MSAPPTDVDSDRRAISVPAWRGDAVTAVPALVVIAIALAWASSYGGFPATHWYPGAVALVLLLAAVVFGLRPAVTELPGLVQIALAGLALFTVWSFASILWADVPGVAWDGANRTLLYFVMFAIPALSRLGGRAGLAVVAAWTIGILVLAVWVLVELPGAVGPGRAVLGPGLAAPVGYANAEACLWLMAAWPALVLASRTALHPALRGLLGGGALVLFDVALLSESSGALIGGALALVVLLAVLPERVRVLLTLVPVGLGAALTAPHAIDVSAARRDAAAPIGELATLATPILGVALGVAALITAAALLERRRTPDGGTVRRAKRAVGIAAAALAVLGVVAALAATGNPVDSVDERWHAFKLGATADPATGAVSGFGGGRYDFYRVALDLIEEHPLNGVGADNFAQEYAARGRALEFPAYVHSIELRTLVHTGVVGALLLAAALGCALLAALRSSRRRCAAGAVAAAAATMVFVHWFAQGSADWFWEFPALGGAAFAMLGVACGLTTRRVPSRARRVRRVPRAAAIGAGAVLVAACCVSLVGPWTAAIETGRASRVWPRDASAAFRQLELAADLNPLSAQPALVEGTIALRRNRLAHAREAFRRALGRSAHDSYATLALGAIASQQGDRRRALVYLRRAVELNRQDGVTIGALAAVRAGRRIDIPALLAQYELLARMAQR